MIRILSQRASLVDSTGRMAAPWFDFLADWVKQYNKRASYFSGSRYELTGTTDATEALTKTVQIGPSGVLRLWINTTATSNANAKSVIIKLSDVTIATLAIDNSTDTQSACLMLCGRGAASQYVSAVYLKNMTLSGGGATTASLSGDSTLAVELQLAASTDTIALESWALDVEQA